MGGGHAEDAEAIAKATHTQLAHWLKPSGYFNIKAKRLQNFCRWYLAQGGYDALNRLDTTGGLVWEDEFSTDGMGRARMERIADRHPGEDGNAPGLSRSFDFRIRIFEDDGRHLLWEDQFAKMEAEEVVESEAVEEKKALQLPTWSGQTGRQIQEELI